MADRDAALADYRRKLLEHREREARVRSLREGVGKSRDEFDKTEDDLKALQSVGQIVGEVLRQLDEDRLIVKASSGPRYVVGCRTKLDKAKLTPGTRVSLDMTTLTIMRALPREVDPVVYNMKHEDPGNVDYATIGGLAEQIRELRESIELPLLNPELFLRVGIKPPKGVLLYGPPGTGKTLLARAIASNMECNFLKVVASAIVDKYIGESARLIREMFGYARENQPCIIFMGACARRPAGRPGRHASPAAAGLTPERAERTPSAPPGDAQTRSTPSAAAASRRAPAPTARSSARSWSS